MKYVTLIQACDEFYKSAQQNKTKEKRIVLDPKKSNVKFYSNFLYNAIKSYALKFSSPKMAKNVFDQIASYNKSPAYVSDKEARDIDMIDAAIREATQRLTAAGLDPVKVLTQKGMVNVNPNILSILHNNLQTVRKAQDFSKYQHYYLPALGEPKEIIEIDDYQAENSPGY